MKCEEKRKVFLSFFFYGRRWSGEQETNEYERKGEDEKWALRVSFGSTFFLLLQWVCIMLVDVYGPRYTINWLLMEHLSIDCLHVLIKKSIFCLRIGIAMYKAQV